MIAVIKGNQRIQRTSRWAFGCFSRVKKLLGRTETRTRERTCIQSIRTVWDIFRDDRARVAISLLSATDLRRIIVSFFPFPDPHVYPSVIIGLPSLLCDVEHGNSLSIRFFSFWSVWLRICWVTNLLCASLARLHVSAYHLHYVIDGSTLQAVSVHNPTGQNPELPKIPHNKIPLYEKWTKSQ